MNWQAIKQSWTVRINAAAMFLLGWVTFDPTPILIVWNMLPVEVRPLIPTQLGAVLGGLLFALSILAHIRPKGN